jgi:heat shock protein HtpX
LRPTFPQLDKDEQEKVVARATCPTLYTLVDRVAHALNTSPVETIIVDGDFNASFRRVGWRRRRVLFLGLPYLALLDPQEYVALIGHELAHGVNGDPNRSLVVGSAIRSLIRWYNLFYPRHLSEAEHPIEILALPLKAVLLLVALMIQSVLDDLVRLNWHSAQRAEYLADALGAQVAGTEASLSLLSKGHYDHTFYLTLKQMSLRDTPGDLFAAAWRQVAQVPPRELERIQRVEQKHKAGGNGTHPPTVYRRDMLLAHPQPTPQVTLAPAEFVRLQGELAALQPRIQAELLDAHRRSLYY